MSTKTDRTMYEVLDDTDRAWSAHDDYDAAYATAHKNANTCNRIFRVRSRRIQETLRIRALAVPLAKKRGEG